MSRTPESGSDPFEQNIKAVSSLEQDALRRRSWSARASDAVINVAAGGVSIAIDLAWFAVWLLLNSRWSPWPPFDPFPYNLLTLIISVEAIFLALLVLGSQNRLTKEADKRAHLDLQVNILAEQEMTLVLRMLRDLCGHFKLETTIRSAAFKALIKETDVQELASRVEQELETNGAAAPRNTPP